MVVGLCGFFGIKQPVMGAISYKSDGHFPSGHSAAEFWEPLNIVFFPANGSGQVHGRPVQRKHHGRCRANCPSE
jgi:hypothetical protein